MAHARLFTERSPLVRVVVPSDVPMRAIATAGIATVWLLAFMLLARRISGGFANPLGPVAALLVSLSLALTVLAVRLAILSAWNRCHQAIVAQRVWPLLVTPAVAGFIAAVAITLPASSTAAAFCLYAPLSLVEIGTLAVVAWRLRQRRTFKWLGAAPWQRARQTVAALQSDGLPAGVTQHLVRSRTPEGTEEIAGALRVKFAPGQRTDVVHVAFCPPFESTPDFETEAAGTESLSVKSVQVFPYGARLEVQRLSASSAATEAVVTFQAVN